MGQLDRIEWVDQAKGVGIVLVVLGHILPAFPGEWSGRLHFLIYLFHMPLFFALSGMFAASASTLNLVTKRARGLLVPYLAYALVITGISLLMSVFAGVGSAEASFKGLIRVAIGGTFSTGLFGVFWYLSCLFTVALLFNEMLKRKDDVLFVSVAIGTALALSAVFTLHRGIPSPWGVFSVPAAFVCYGYGYMLRRSGCVTGLSVVALGIVFVAAALPLDYAFDLKTNLSGPPVIGVALALALTTLVVLILQRAQHISFMRPLALIGVYSLPIMMLHVPVFVFLRGLGVEDPIIWTAASLGVPLAMGIAFNRIDVTSKLFLGRPASGSPQSLRAAS